MTEEIHAFIDERDVKDIEAPFFKEGETVTIKKFSYADRQFLSGEYTRLSAEWRGKGGRRGKTRGGKEKRGDKEKQSATVTSEIVLGKMNMSILWRGIKSWVLYGRSGDAVSLSRRNLQRLSDAYAEFILEAINDFNPSRSEPEDGDEDGDGFFLVPDEGSEGDG